MPSNPVPTLTSWIQNSGEKLDQVMTNFTQSNYSQSYCYQGHISSLPYIIATSQYDQNTIRSETESVLTTYLNRYYDSVELVVKVKYIDPTTERLDLSVGGFVVDNGVSYDMASLLRVENGEFISWETTNNEG